MLDDPRLAEQVKYYRAIANEYQDHRIDAPGKRELIAAFESFDIHGDVLEFTCGQGLWTERLVRDAGSLTVVDASPEMIDLARSRVEGSNVRFIEADILSWQPDRRYDAVFFGFWLSHVPEEHFAAFWDLVAETLEPDGRVFFVDDNHRTATELIEGPNSAVVERRLNDGSTFRVIKVPHEPKELQSRLGSMGWHLAVNGLGPFYWGAGHRSME